MRPIQKYKENHDRSREAGKKNQAGFAAAGKEHHRGGIAKVDWTGFRRETCWQLLQPCEVTIDVFQAAELLQNLSNGCEQTKQGPPDGDDVAGVGSAAGPGLSTGNAGSQATGERRQEARSSAGGNGEPGGSTSISRGRSSRGDDDGGDTQSTIKHHKSALRSRARSRREMTMRGTHERSGQAVRRSIRLESKSRAKSDARVAEELVKWDLAGLKALGFRI